MSRETTAAAARLELPEARTMYVVESQAPAITRRALGIATDQMAGGVILAMSHDGTGYWNKALGFGLEAPVTTRTIADVITFYRDHAAPQAVLQIAPDALPPDWPAICTEHSLAASSSWTKYVGDVDEVIDRAETLVRERPGLVAETVGVDDAEEWATVCMRAFGFPEEHYASMMAAFAARLDVVPCAVRRQGRIVGAAAVRLDDPAAHLFACAVLPEAHRQGGQTALLLARARAARSAGCSVLVAETESEQPGSHVTSRHNLLRVGMTPSYDRTNWLWKPAPDRAPAELLRR